MKAGRFISAVLGMIVRVVFIIGVIYVIYRGATICYEYGYRIFTEPAVSEGEGRTVTLTVTGNESLMELGEMFADKGLVRDSRLFVLQYLFSEYREDVVPGTFEFSTAMTAEEMMAVMAAPAQDETQDETQGGTQ
ncbi:MAG: endolytic transglycosylase MltG [Candidatus Gastranaerophilales bacterium]|nr:endolytic transglycosylase MltG [Candidatus Gastranaerophilales bacterium]